MTKKTTGKILIAIGILIVLFGVYLLSLKGDNKIETSQNNIPENIIQPKTILEIDGVVYESVISGPISVYDFMSQLQNEGKINFKEKTYAGMGKFIEEINGVKSNSEKYWLYSVNGKKAEVGVSDYQINIGDTVSWKYKKGDF